MINVKPAPAEIIHMSFRAETTSHESTDLDSDDDLGTAKLVKKLPKERRHNGVRGHADRQPDPSCSASHGDHMSSCDLLIDSLNEAFYKMS